MAKKAFVVTGGTIMQKKQGVMVPHKKGDTVFLEIDEKGNPINRAMLSRVEEKRPTRKIARDADDDTVDETNPVGGTNPKGKKASKTSKV
jgi:hypothetical protein